MRVSGGAHRLRASLSNTSPESPSLRCLGQQSCTLPYVTDRCSGWQMLNPHCKDAWRNVQSLCGFIQPLIRCILIVLFTGSLISINPVFPG